MNDGGEGRGGGWDGRLEASLSGEALIEGEWEALGLEDERARARGLHHALLSLRCALASVELMLGRGFASFAPGGPFSFEPLGYPTREAGCFERFGISWSLARQFVDLERALVRLPLAREAFLLGLVERSKLSWLVKVATSTTEAGWLALAKRRGDAGFIADVKRFQAGELSADRVRAEAARGPGPGDPGTEAREYLRLSGTPAEAAAVRSWAFDVVRKVAGDDKLPAGECLELLCADAMAGMDVEIPDAGPPDDDAASQRRIRALKLDDEKLLELAARWRVQEVAVPLEIPDPSIEADLGDAMGALMTCVRLRQRILAERASLLHWLDGSRLWRHLGASSLAAYAGRALGMPPKDLTESLRLRARLSMLPRVRAAWLRGMLPAFAARQVASVAAHDTEDAWLEHVKLCTGKRLDAETRWHDLALHALPLARWRKETDGGRPQPSLAMEDLRKGIERMARECVQRLDGEAPEVRAVVEIVPRVTSFGVWVPSLVAPLVRSTLDAKRADIGPRATDGEALLQMAERLLAQVAPERLAMKREMRVNRAVFERDGWQCANPHCRSRRNLHAHHVEFRSHGGCDAAWNEVTLCASCHLRLLHQGFLKIVRAGPAPSEDFIFVLPHVGERWREGLRVAA